LADGTFSCAVGDAEFSGTAPIRRGFMAVAQTGVNRGSIQPHCRCLYHEYHDKGVEFIGVSLDLPVDAGGLVSLKKFVKERNIPWPQYYLGHDNERIVSGAATDDFAEWWGINGIPTVFLVDAEGKLFSTEARGKLDTLIPLLLKKVQ
jgi:hypothetical protein